MWRWGAALQRWGISSGNPGDPWETQGEPGRRGRHTETTQDGGADQEWARRSVMKGDAHVARCVICNSQPWLWLTRYSLIALLSFLPSSFSTSCLYHSISLSRSLPLLQTHTHSDKRQAFVFQHIDRQHQLFGPIVHQCFAYLSQPDK